MRNHVVSEEEKGAGAGALSGGTTRTNKRLRCTLWLTILLMLIYNTPTLLLITSDVHEHSSVLGGNRKDKDDNHPSSLMKSDAKLQDTQRRQLVIDVGEEHMFWRGPLVCELLRNVTGVAHLGDEPSFYHSNASTASTSSTAVPLLNFTLDCSQLDAHTGNWVTAFFMMRLAAAMARVDFQFQCREGMRDQRTDVLPWFTGYYQYAAPASFSSSPSSSQQQQQQHQWPYDFGQPADKDCFAKFRNIALHHIGREIQNDIRRIATAMIGPRKRLPPSSSLRPPTEDDHPSVDDTSGHVPLFASEEIDDVAIHFRCGDVFGVTKKAWYGIIPFRLYAERIPNSTQSIGIHTQPFDASRLRPDDRTTVNQCQQVVQTLVTYLQDRHPKATINVRNTVDDTLPLTFARMTMAKQTIVSISTFGIYPAIASFGEGYFFKSAKQNRFAQNISTILPNLHMMEGPFMSSPEIKKSSTEQVLQFLTQR